MQDKTPDNNEEILATILNAKEVAHEIKSTELIPPYSNNDFEYAKGNIMTIIEKGNEALTEMMELAKETGHPRVFEVLTTLMSTLIAANRDLIETKKTNQDIEIRSGKKMFANTINNNLIMTTDELSKILKGSINSEPHTTNKS